MKWKKIFFITLFTISILSWTLMINELQFNIASRKQDYKEDTVEFLINHLWDQEYSGFYAYIANNVCIPCGAKAPTKYTSFNSWAIRALLQYSISHNDSYIFEEYGLKTLNFVLNNLLNKTNKGFYHWINQNGSLPAEGDLLFNNSVYQIGTYQAWMLITLIEVYKYTLNSTYINVWGKDVANFLITKLWDSEHGGFYSTYIPFYDQIVDFLKYTWYQAWPAIALLDFYEITGNQTYMTYVNNTLDFLINYLLDSNTESFLSQCFENGTVDPNSIFMLTDQAAILLAFSKASNLTGNQTYRDDYLLPILNFTKNYLWNDEFSQFYYDCDKNGENPELYQRPSDLSFCLFALSQVINNLNDTNSFKKIIDYSMKNMITNAWDYNAKGFYRKFFFNGTIADQDKWTIEQTIPLFLFCHYSPEHPISSISFYIFLGIFVGTIVSIIFIYFKRDPHKKLIRHIIK